MFFADHLPNILIEETEKPRAGKLPAAFDEPLKSVYAICGQTCIVYNFEKMYVKSE